MLQFAETKLGGIDVLVMGHMISRLKPWVGTPEDFTHLSQSINVNFYSYVGIATHAIPALEKSKGTIIVLGSGVGKYDDKLMKIKR